MTEFTGRNKCTLYQNICGIDHKTLALYYLFFMGVGGGGGGLVVF